MHKDIRLFFKPLKGGNSNNNSNANDQPKPSTSGKKRVISSDEEVENSQHSLKRPKRITGALQTGDVTVLKNESINTKKNDAEPEPKIIKPSEVFGDRPIRRIESVRIQHKQDMSQSKEVPLSNTKDSSADGWQESFSGNDSMKESVEQNEASKAKTVHKKKKKEEGRHQEGKEMLSLSKTRKNLNQSSRKHGQKSMNEEECSGGVSQLEVTIMEPSTSTKKKNTPDEDVFKQIVEKKKQNAEMYQKYLNRGGARNPGSKEIPIGADYCFNNVKFVITGVFDSLERHEIEGLIVKYHGRVLRTITGSTDYLIVGYEPGPSKIQKAELLKIPQISEDQFLDMIKTRPPGLVSCKEDYKNQRSIATDKKPTSIPIPNVDSSNVDDVQIVDVRMPDNECCNTNDLAVAGPSRKSHSSAGRSRSSLSPTGPSRTSSSPAGSSKDSATCTMQNTFDKNQGLSLVDKYRPQTMQQLVGQQGDRSPAKKLFNWLMNWHKHRKSTVKPVKAPAWSKSDDGALFKAALLSGSPGVGKTTTAHVVCKELAFDLVEFNASDTRNKKLLQESVGEILCNTSLKTWSATFKHKPTRNRVLLMDEVDGMAGNEDRGGIQELVNMIKATEIPIICICNDRANAKMKTLTHYTYDLRFQKPKLEQIRGAMKSICFKEKILNVPNERLDQIIESTNMDIRQVLHQLELFSKNSWKDEEADKKALKKLKDVRLGPWDVARKVFSAEEQRHMSLREKVDLFFHDYNVAGLFVQENYLSVIPDGPNHQVMDKIARTADSLSIGDIVDKTMRTKNIWSFLTIEAYFSSVIPGSIMSGHIGGQLNFPSWFGRNSKAGKSDRLLQELTVHIHNATRAEKEAVTLDYAPVITRSIVKPLKGGSTENVAAAVDVMKSYHLLREDLNSLVEVTSWPGSRDPMQDVDSKVKASFTRLYNKKCTVLPYLGPNSIKKKGRGGGQAVSLNDDEDEENDEDEDEEESSELNDSFAPAKQSRSTKKAPSKTAVKKASGINFAKANQR